MTTFDQNKQTLIITGYSSAIGQHLVNNLLTDGYYILLFGRRPVSLPATLPPNYQHVYMDMSDPTSILRAFESPWIDSSLIGLLHLAFDTPLRQRFIDLSPEMIDSQVKTNIIGSMTILQKVVTFLSHNSFPDKRIIINYSSQLARFQAPELSTYGLSKSAINNLVKTIAHEYGEYQIRANNILLGKITNQTTISDPELSIPLKRYGTPSDILGFTNFPLSSSSSYITGQDLNLNGGR